MDIRNFIGGNDRVDYPTMMIYTRRLLQNDNEKFGKVHYIEADLAVSYINRTMVFFSNSDYLLIKIVLLQVHAIAGGSQWNPEMFRKQFTGPKILYDVSKCETVSAHPLLLFFSNASHTLKYVHGELVKQIYVQLCDVNHWNCYAFDLRQHKIHILDSSKSGKNDEVQPGSKHHWIVPMLARAMQECLTLFFPDWTEDVSKWDYKEPVVPTQSFEYDHFSTKPCIVIELNLIFLSLF